MFGRGRAIGSVLKSNKLLVNEDKLASDENKEHDKQQSQQSALKIEKQFAEASPQTSASAIAAPVTTENVPIKRVGFGRGRTVTREEPISINQQSPTITQQQSSIATTPPEIKPVSPISTKIVHQQQDTILIKPTSRGMGRGMRVQSSILQEPSKLSSPPKPQQCESIEDTLIVPTNVPRTTIGSQEQLTKKNVMGRSLGRGRGVRPLEYQQRSSSPQTTLKEEKEKYADVVEENKETRGSSEPSSSIQSTSLSTIATTTVAGTCTDPSIRAMEKAIENIKIEEIVRASPIVRMGESGHPSEMYCNMIKLKCKNAGVYQYVVHFEPQVDSSLLRFKFVYNNCKDLFENIGKQFDGMHLFLSKMLPNNITHRKAIRETDGEEINIRIQLVKILPPNRIPMQVLNIALKRIMHLLGLKRINDNYFDDERRKPVEGYKMELWPGYVASVQEVEDGLYLMCDVAHKVVRATTAYDLICDLSNKYASNEQQFKEQVTKELIGCVVLTRYNNRTYRIDDIRWNENPQCTFDQNANNTRTTYVDYYKRQYNIEIKDERQPLLICNQKKNHRRGFASEIGEEVVSSRVQMLCLIPELCCLTGLTDNLRSNSHVMKDLSKITRVEPTMRFYNISEYIEKVKASEAAYAHLKVWGLEFDEEGLTKVQGRVLDRERIEVGNCEKFTGDDQCDWSREMSRRPMLTCVDLNNWLMIFTNTKSQEAKNFYDCMLKNARSLGLRIQEPTIVQLNDDKTDTYIRKLKECITSNTQICVVIFPTMRDDRYSAVKRLLCIDIPVPSQVINAKTISDDRKLNSVTQKILLQINCKLGGELWRLQIPIQKLMIIGIDTYHQNVKHYKSLAGFVASMNHDQTRWFSKVAFQASGQELVDGLKVAFIESLRRYYDNNGFYPDRIIIYRDGVSDSQLSYVIEHEVEQFKTCFIENYRPKLSMIVVQKRISQRFFAIKPNSSQEPFVNPKPGSIIDNKVTRFNQYDFFLVSQHVRQGTVTPSHYLVVYDDSSFKPDHMQRITYKMTHLYYNWSGTIRVPAPCQYAHKLAFLVGQHLQREPSDELASRLYYL